MSILEVRAAAELLDKAQRELEKAIKERGAVSCNGHQDRIVVSINGTHIDLTELDKGYSSRVIRGREMIALGVAKLLNENVEWHRKNVSEKKVNLSQLAAELSRVK